MPRTRSFTPTCCCTAAVRRDGRVVAIDSKAWFLHRRELGAAYRTELAHELSKLGYRIECGTGRGGRYFEIAGVPKPLIDQWSSRSHQIERAIEQRLARTGSGRLTPAKDRLIRVSTRQAKQPVTLTDLDREWQATARKHGFDHENVRTPARRSVAPADSVRVRRALTDFDATFTSREARAVALEQSTGVRIQNALQSLAELRATGQLLTLADGRLTTREHRGKERETVAAMQRIAAQATIPIPAHAVEHAAEIVSARLGDPDARLSEEQRLALDTASADRRLTVIEGQAGTGKSTVLQAVAIAHRDAGRRIIVTSTAALAAERLAGDVREVGVDASAYSTAALMQGISDGRIRLSPATTVIHDEAALASTREQRDLMRALERSGARLVLVGDAAAEPAGRCRGLWERIERTTREQEAPHNAHHEPAGTRSRRPPRPAAVPRRRP